MRSEVHKLLSQTYPMTREHITAQTLGPTTLPQWPAECACAL